MLYLVRAVAVLLVASSSVLVIAGGPAIAQTHDGSWTGNFSCDEFKGYKAFSIRVVATVSNDVMSLETGAESLSGTIGQDGHIVRWS